MEDLVDDSAGVALQFRVHGKLSWLGGLIVEAIGDARTRTARALISIKPDRRAGDQTKWQPCKL
jgi:hypothetical protein